MTLGNVSLKSSDRLPTIPYMWASQGVKEGWLAQAYKCVPHDPITDLGLLLRVHENGVLVSGPVRQKVQPRL